MAALIVAAVVVMVKVLVWAAAVMNMLVVVEVLAIGVRADVSIDAWADVEIIAVAAIVSALKFAVPIS